MQSLVTHAGILFRWYTFRNVASAWLNTSISTSTQVLVLVLKFRRAVSSCLETDTPAGDSTLSKRGRGLEGRVAFGVQPESATKAFLGLPVVENGLERELRTRNQHEPNEDAHSREELQFS